MYQVSSPENKLQFDKYYFFRWQNLRKPLNKKLGSERDDIESTSIHRMIINDKNIIFAVGRLHFNSNTEAQVRYFAIDKAKRRLGIGSFLMNDLESISKDNKRNTIVLEARENAIKFYESLDYKVIQKTHLLFGKIQHYKMKKVL